MRILKVEPDKAPYEKEIENTLENAQSEVGGGRLETVFLAADAILCCNEEGKILGMRPNRRVGGDIICGPFFIVGFDGIDDFQSLTDQQIAAHTLQFADIEHFAAYEPAMLPHMEINSF